MKNKLTHELTLLDVSLYRKSGLSDADSKYKKEPLHFRSMLFDIYSKLSIEDIEKIINLKK